ncbi:hypothetical protein TKK_0015272 [Trichogramma kaykai]
MVKNKRIPLKFVNFIADAPARALILNHRGHNGTEPCSKCKVAGYKFENRTMVFPGINFEKRNDSNYEAQNYEDHQKGATPLFRLGISSTLNTPFEVMHLVYLGLTVKHLAAWICGKYGYGPKLSKLFGDELSRRFVSLNDYCPNDFTRRPRTLSKPNKLKATELRHFLLYASSVVCEDIISDDCLLHLRNHPKPLQQFANRLREKQGIQHIQLDKSSSNNPKVSIRHAGGPIPFELTSYSYKQFKKYEDDNFCFVVDDHNNYCQIKDDSSLCKIEDILLVNDQVIVAIKRYSITEDVFESPIRSSSVGIFKCSKLSNELHMVLITDVSCKCYRMPVWKNFSKKHSSDIIDEEYIMSTLLHTVN